MDTFRKNYTPLTDLQKDWMLEVKTKAEELLASMESKLIKEERSERSRLIAIGKTQLEIAVAMAVKGITT